MERQVLGWDRAPDEDVWVTRQRLARRAERLAIEMDLEPWHRILVRRHWRFAQDLLLRPDTTCEASVLRLKGAAWRVSRMAKAGGQLHGCRGRWWHWDEWIQRFARECGWSTWESAADPATLWWAQSEDAWVVWRLEAWEGRGWIPAHVGSGSRSRLRQAYRAHTPDEEGDGPCQGPRG